MIRIAAAAATGDNIDRIIDQIISKIQHQMQEDEIHLGIAFVSKHFASSIKSKLSHLENHLRIENLIGCTAEGVIGPEAEYESKPAISLWTAHLPGAHIEPIIFDQEVLEKTNTAEKWQHLFHVQPGIESNIFLLADPFSLNIKSVLEGLNSNLPGFPLLGGMASGAQSPGQNILFHNDQWFNDGCVGVSISGNVLIDHVISQGCKPIGEPYLITKGEKNVIDELGGKPALLVLNDLYNALDPREHQLMENGIFIGRAIDEYKGSFNRGDFLIRNVMGIDQETYSISVMDQIKAGITIQFHVRDEETADEDLRTLLNPYNDSNTNGALVFSCNGRGTRMFSQPNHDLDMIKKETSTNAVAGFFCAGELGPVGGQNFIHGHTASIAIFRSKKDA